MNIQPAHLEALRAFGYTEHEARFLYIVATHSGYFTARQFLVFTGAHWGKRTTLFWNKLKDNKHARTECFPRSSVVYHLFSRRLYRRIEKENVRNRRPHEIEFIKRRIVMLDFVLLNHGHRYLETEQEKVRFFCGDLSIEKQYLPARLYVGRKTARTSIRYFVDKFPMFLAFSPPVVTFTYVHEGSVAFTDFIRHLENYLPLFRQLSEFGLIYLSRTDAHFRKAAEIFASAVKIPLESDIADDLLRYFRVRRAWDEKQYAAVSDSDLIFRNHAQERFRSERFESFFRGWKNGGISDRDIRCELATNDRRRTIHFEARVVRAISLPGEHPEKTE